MKTKRLPFYRFQAVLFAAFLLFSFGAKGQATSLNVEQIGHLSYNSNLNDIWAYVDGNGTEYALVGAVDGVSIVDLTSPSTPTEIHFLPGINTTWRDLKTWGDHAYVTNEGGDGLRIIDLSGLPNTVSYVDTMVDGLSTAHNIYIDSAGYAYVVGGNANYFGVGIWDLNGNPNSPPYVGGWSQDYIHDIYVRDSLAFASLIYTGELAIINIADRSNPVLLGKIAYQNGFTHNAWLSDNSNYCFTTDELDYAYLTAWDVSDPTNIVYMDRIRSSVSNEVAMPHNTHVLNDFLVTSYYADGLHVTDAARPHNLVEVGYYDTNPQSGIGSFGAWGAYPYLPSGLILCTDMGEGLYVLRADYIRGSYLEGQARNTTTTLPVPNVLIELVGTSVNEPTGVTGDYAVGIADSGMYMARASSFGYLPTDTSIVMSPGQVIFWNPKMQASPMVNLSILVEEAGSGLPIENAVVSMESQGNVFTYTTNASGMVSNSSFVSSNYEVFAGKWGYVTNGLTQQIDSSTGTLVIQLDKGYYDDFALDFNWTTSGNSGSGLWERGIPNLTTYFGFNITPDMDVQDDWGRQCYVTGNLGGNLGDDEVGFGYTEMVSPSMDLSGYNEPWIVFDWFHFAASASGSNGFRDSLVVEVDNGVEKKRVWFRRDLQGTGFVRDSVRISDYLLPTANVVVHIRSSDRLNANFVESAIDRVLIWDDPTVALTPEVADFKLEAWPNPGNGPFRVAYDLQGQEQGQLTIFNLQGQALRTIPVSQSQGELIVDQELPSGMYLVQLEAGEQRKTIRWIRN